MPNTTSTRAEMIAAYADQTSRGCTMNTHRDGVVSYMGCIGKISGPDNPLSLSATPAILEFQTSDIAVDLTNALDTAAGIDCDDDGYLGVYLIAWMLAIEADDADQEIGLRLYADAVAIDDLWLYQILSTKPETLVGSTLYDMTAQKKIDLRITGTDTVTYSAGHLLMKRVG